MTDEKPTLATEPPLTETTRKPRVKKRRFANMDPEKREAAIRAMWRLRRTLRKLADR